MAGPDPDDDPLVGPPSLKPWLHSFGRAGEATGMQLLAPPAAVAAGASPPLAVSRDRWVGEVDTRTSRRAGVGLRAAS